ncbi:nicotinate phosphoribosyltransferase [Brevibacillus porteri]|uniref:Nicotinate phosphoribosyltransferase n=1 Tax=Brevibacillus porteri TaxID=2126350 RepID=A0ABX5FT81_9BACL|nr:nicotinate phosphoribosyltransferase [Brevibacillus porteri]MED1797355.1 nicotinate phosphoribosyltransferase [Brevibacillus porteri]MED2129425.1 nicotinate phosphoribosyltransferase [Brevibacillus porteri]MED2747652.1 nicotinate phosphoribosyltransferase [Brevibacillus porteri]MED2815667.1 nicotinate phosphoribosyltransferase [Brevibacillus porteri]MED2896780.1 nicotinate phosphoribosyltransferase [Brevibacillus porteri]
MQSFGVALHTDKYQINMMYAHWVNGTHNQKVVFEAFFRKLPFGNGYAVSAGLERIVSYIKNLSFEESDLKYLSEQEENYDPKFLEELRQLRFKGSLYSVKEGTVVFPNEPLIRVEGRVMEAQLVETALLNYMNYQTLIATKASRIKNVAGNDVLMEFGTRRAQEADAALWGTRAAYLAGFDATSNMLAGKMFGIPTKGTHAHSWVQSFESEEEAFERFAAALPGQVTLLVDTYDTLKSGVPNAIKVGKRLEKQGKKLTAVRLDSGDLTYLSCKTREMLDKAGMTDVQIVASNDLDEHTIMNLKVQGARVNSWGVGTQLITAADQPTLGGVYKLVAREGADGEYQPTIKISGNPEKVTTPGIKDMYRLIDPETGKAIADYMCFPHETTVDDGGPLHLFHPSHTYLSKHLENYQAESLLIPVFVDGELVYELPTLQDIRNYHREQLKLFWPEYLRMLNPEHYRLHISEEMWETKTKLMKTYLKK